MRGILLVISWSWRRFVDADITLSFFLNWLAKLFPTEHPLHHAGFAKLHQLKALLSRTLDGAHLLLGIGENGYILRVALSEKCRELGNVLINSRTRGGKGLFAIAQILSWTESAVINDIKRELRPKTAGFRKTRGNVWTFDPTGYGDRFDPFLGKETEDDLRNTATSLLFHANEGENTIFTDRAITMLTQLLLAARVEEEPLLLFVQWAIYAGPIDTAKRLHSISIKHNLYPNLATRFLDMSLADMIKLSFNDKFFISGWSTMKHRMEPVLTDVVLRSLSGSDFTARDIITGDKPATLYLCWPERSLDALGPLIRLVWTSLTDEMIDIYDSLNEEERTRCWQVFNFMDEVGRTAFPKMADYCSTGVGRGLIFWMAFQSPSQIAVIYGRERANIILDNMDTQIFYRPPNYRTARELRDELGDVSGYAHSMTMREGAEASQSQVEQAVALLTAQDIRQLDDEDVLIFHANYAPIRANRMDFRRFPELKERTQIDPPPLPAFKPVRQSQMRGMEEEGDETMPEFVNPEQFARPPFSG